HRADVHAATSELVVEGIREILLGGVHARIVEDGRLAAGAGRMVHQTIHVLAVLERNHVPGYGAVEQLDEPIVAAHLGRVIGHLLRILVLRDEMLGAPVVERRAMIMLARSDAPSALAGIVREAFLLLRDAGPLARERASSGNAMEHALHVGIFEAALE